MGMIGDDLGKICCFGRALSPQMEWQFWCESFRPSNDHLVAQCPESEHKRLENFYKCSKLWKFCKTTNLKTSNSSWLDEINSHPLLTDHVWMPKVCCWTLSIVVAGNAGRSGNFVFFRRNFSSRKFVEPNFKTSLQTVLKWLHRFPFCTRWLLSCWK